MTLSGEINPALIRDPAKTPPGNKQHKMIKKTRIDRFM
ncbi:hypothetical protein SeGA_0419 [Salmonella enterica subsp. enterica serovar Gaminara str. A4-567]|nr:hypothetical protein SeGA_0419 [Salmonella enterica subsp. enterica serovar Gaminara str. A4-567]